MLGAADQGADHDQQAAESAAIRIVVRSVAPKVDCLVVFIAVVAPRLVRLDYDAAPLPTRDDGALVPHLESVNLRLANDVHRT